MTAGDRLRKINDGWKKGEFIKGLDPNFGDETEYTSNATRLENKIVGGKDTCPEAGIADSISIYLYGGWSAGYRIKCAMYNADKGFIASTEERDDGGSKHTWQSFNFSAPKPPLSASTDYILVVWSDAGVELASKSGAPANSHWYQTETYNGFPDPLGDPTSSYHRSIYCTYTAAPAAGFKKLQYFTEPPTAGAFNKLKFASEPPVSGAWNKLLYEGE